MRPGLNVRDSRSISIILSSAKKASMRPGLNVRDSCGGAQSRSRSSRGFNEARTERPG